MFTRLKKWFRERRESKLDDVERWRKMMDERKGMNTQEPNYWGDMSEADDITRWKKIVNERFNKIERDQKELDGGKRRLRGLALGGAIVVAFAGAAAVYRSAIPFGAASSWSAATGNDPSATTGLWFNNNTHSFTHRNNLDYQLDTTPYFVTAYGAVCDGITDDTTAFQNTAAAAPTGSTVVIPPGNCVLKDTVSFSLGNVHVVGSGIQTTTITFNPATAKAAFTWDNGGAVDRLYGGSLEGIYFKAGNSTVQKIAVDLVDTSGFTIQNVWVDPAASSNIPWTGNNSIGIRLRGRELTTIDHVRLWADTPIAVVTDPYITTPVNCDHTHISNTYLLSKRGAGTACMSIDPGITVTNMIIDGDNAWIVDKYGLKWDDTGGGTGYPNSQNILISGIRMEQFNDANPYGFYIVRDQVGLQNVVFQNIQIGSNTNAFYLDGGAVSGMDFITLQNALLSNTSGSFNDLTTLGSVRDLVTINCLFNAGSGNNLNVTPVVSTPKSQVSLSLPPTNWYLDSASVTHIQQLTTAITSVAALFTNTSATNTNPVTFDTTNAFTGANSLFLLKTGGVTTHNFQANGSLILNQDLRIAAGGAGTIDMSSGIQLQLCPSNCSSVALGRAGATGVFVVAPTIAAAVAGTQTIGGGGSFFGSSNIRHYIGAGSAPGAPAAGTGCNTSSAASNTGTDSSGTINITCGGTGATSATVLTMAFNTSWGANPRCPIFAANAATAAIPAAQIPFTSASTSTLTMTSNTTGLAAGTYSWFYKCEQ